jgi:hypothetical protein
LVSMKMKSASSPKSISRAISNAAFASNIFVRPVSPTSLSALGLDDIALTLGLADNVLAVHRAETARETLEKFVKSGVHSAMQIKKSTSNSGIG